LRKPAEIEQGRKLRTVLALEEDRDLRRAAGSETGAESDEGSGIGEDAAHKITESGEDHGISEESRDQRTIIDQRMDAESEKAGPYEGAKVFERPLRHWRVFDSSGPVNCRRAEDLRGHTTFRKMMTFSAAK
jgi:hypothetical protein